MTDVELEQRLRQALDARARAVTAQDLRPVVSERRATVRWWLPLSAGLAAAAVLALIFLVFHRPDADERPIAPAASVPATRPTDSVPATTGPTASASSTVTPVPSTTAAGARPAGPSNVVPSRFPGATPDRFPAGGVVPRRSVVPSSFTTVQPSR
jgi:hypothetical protein